MSTALIVFVALTAVLTAVTYVTLRRIPTSRPRPRFTLGIDVSAFDRNLYAVLWEERIAMTVVRPESFVMVVLT